MQTREIKSNTISFLRCHQQQLRCYCCLGFPAVKLGLSPGFSILGMKVSSLTIWLSLLISCLDTQGGLSVSLEKADFQNMVECYLCSVFHFWQLLCERLVCRSFWFISNKGRLSLLQQLAVVRIWTGTIAEVLLEIVWRHFCIFLMAIQKKSQFCLLFLTERWQPAL